MPSIFHFAWLIPLTPLLAFVLIVLFTHRDRAASQQVATYGIVIPCLLALMVFWSAVLAAPEGELPIESTLIDRWFSLGDSNFSVALYIDPVGAVMLFALALTCLMLLTYSKGMVQNESNASSFFAIFSLLTASAFGLLIFDNLLIFFALWEIIDVCAYLLIGLRREGESAHEASLKAFMTTKVSDLAFLLGLALLYATTRSLTYSEIFSPGALEPPLAKLTALLLFGGVVGKSAQFPLHVWLIGANEAPTPAAALIHTVMTSAGVFLLVRAFPLFEAAAQSLLIADMDMTIVTLVGALTALFAAFVALAQRDIRHALSFSVIGQLGYAVAALGMGAYAAGVFQLIASLFFNTLLLLAAGSVVHGMRRARRESDDENFDPHDMLDMGGLSRQQPITFWAFFIGAMALAGLPFITSGFWSRSAILLHAWAGDQVACWLLALAAGAIALSATRQVCLIFFGPPRTQAAAHAPESEPAMTTPLIVLAILALALSLIGIPEQLQLIPNWLGTFIGAQGSPADFAVEPMLLEIAFGTIGLMLGFLIYFWRPMQAGDTDRLEWAMERVGLGWFYKLVRDRFYIDRLYRLVFARGCVLLAAALNACDGALDRLVNGAARLAQAPSQFSNWFEIGVLDALVNLSGVAGARLASVGGRLDGRLDAAVNLAAPAGERLAQLSGAFDLRLHQLANLIQAGALALVKLGASTDKVLDAIVESFGGAVRAAGLWFRPKSGRAQSYLLWASTAILMLTAVFLFLFPKI